jgi:hypothetical protein
MASFIMIYVHYKLNEDWRRRSSNIKIFSKKILEAVILVLLMGVHELRR